MRYIFMLPIILLCGCATAYQPQSFSGGFTETQLSENIFQVNFNGNGYTDQEKATDFSLLRSAELTLEHGFKYFAVVDSQNDSSISAHTTPLQAHTTVNTNTYGTLNSYGNYGSYSGDTYGTADTYFTGGNTYYISKPSAAMTIICTNEKLKDIFVLDAAFLQKSLRAKYRIPEKITTETKQNLTNHQEIKYK